MFSSQIRIRITQRAQFLVFCIGLISLLISPNLLANSDHDLQITDADILDIGALKSISDSGLSEIIVATSGRKLTLRLSKNDRLVENLPAVMDDPELALYKGVVVGIPNSWVRMTMANNHLTGAFYDGVDLHFIDLLNTVKDNIADTAIDPSRSQDENTMVVYKASDIEHSGVCALDSANASSFSKMDYQALVDELADVAAASASKQLKIAVVADTEFDAATGGNATASMLAEMNIVDGIYSEQLDLQMTVESTTALTNNANLTSTSASTLLDQLMDYANSELSNPGLVHLFTGKELNGSTIGIAYIGAACSSFGTGVTQKLGGVTALIAAHEFGHNLGAPHDNQGGSVCASTPGTFLMNPRINGSDTFSNCSIGQMNNFISRASCIVANDGNAPAITSTANLNAMVGEAYLYDDNGKLEASGSATITYELDFGPDGMTLTNDGELNWTPDASQAGTQSVQITATNTFGSDSQAFDIEVTSTGINFNTSSPGAYAGSQDGQGTVDIVDGGTGLSLKGNRWQSIDFNYTITRNTVLEFDFSSSSEGEIHGIGLDNNSAISANRTFALFGSQNYGIQNYRYDGNGGVQRFVIPVGQFYTGLVRELFFVMDHDVSSPDGESVFSNVQVYESSANLPGLNFNDFDLTNYGRSQETMGAAQITDQGNTLQVQGNMWLSIDLTGTIQSDTVLEFDFRSNTQGEIHGIGLDNNSFESANRSFQLLGTQKWGIGNFEYTGNGAVQKFEIPIGQFYTGSYSKMFFITDHDVADPNAESVFSNIIIR